MAQLVLTSVGLFCACASSWSGGQRDGPGLRAEGTAEAGGHVWFFAPALAVWKFGWGFPGVLLISLSQGGVGIGYFCPMRLPFLIRKFIDAGCVQPPALFSFLSFPKTISKSVVLAHASFYFIFHVL